MGILFRILKDEDGGCYVLSGLDPFFNFLILGDLKANIPGSFRLNRAFNHNKQPRSGAKIITSADEELVETTKLLLLRIVFIIIIVLKGTRLL